MAGSSDFLLERIADRLKAMADPMRLKILHVLQNGEHCVNEILHEVGGSQANVSKHLSVLKRAGLVDCRRKGILAYYRIDDPEVFEICKICCDGLDHQAKVAELTIAQGRAEMMERSR